MLSEQQTISETLKIEELIMDKDNLKKQDYGSILRALIFNVYDIVCCSDNIRLVLLVLFVKRKVF
jgi:hypothetical protein